MGLLKLFKKGAKTAGGLAVGGPLGAVAGGLMGGKKGKGGVMSKVISAQNARATAPSKDGLVLRANAKPHEEYRPPKIGDISKPGKAPQDATRSTLRLRKKVVQPLPTPTIPALPAAANSIARQNKNKLKNMSRRITRGTTAANPNPFKR
jgi:hypothetical protein